MQLLYWHYLLYFYFYQRSTLVFVPFFLFRTRDKYNWLSVIQIHFLYLHTIWSKWAAVRKKNVKTIASMAIHNTINWCHVIMRERGREKGISTFYELKLKWNELHAVDSFTHLNSVWSNSWCKVQCIFLDLKDWCVVFFFSLLFVEQSAVFSFLIPLHGVSVYIVSECSLKTRKLMLCNFPTCWCDICSLLTAYRIACAHILTQSIKFQLSTYHWNNRL